MARVISTAASGTPAGSALAPAILDWYDRHHRDLPWRVSPAAQSAGARADPYRVWLSEVMLQQTTVAAATGHFLRFLARWPDIRALAAAPRAEVLGEWAGLGYYARARNLHACAVAVAARPGAAFPDTEEGLRALPGIGAYTAAAIAAIAFDRPAAVVDGNVERVMARLFAETEPMPAVKPRLRAHAARLTPAERPGDYAQAVMDLGATICTPRRPACAICPWRDPCEGRRLGIADTLPAKLEKLAKPVRQGTAFLAIGPDGRVGTVRRPDSGLLGGMLALPSTEWAEEAPPVRPPFTAAWRPAGEVRHTFTHFHLRLGVMVAATPEPPGAVPAVEALKAMPTVFRKALRLGLSAAEKNGGPEGPP